MACISDQQNQQLQGSFVLIQTCGNPDQNRSIRFVAYAGLLMLNFDPDLSRSNSPGSSDSLGLNSYLAPFD